MSPLFVYCWTKKICYADAERGQLNLRNSPTFLAFFRLRYTTRQRPCAIQDINYLFDCHLRQKIVFILLRSSLCRTNRGRTERERGKKATNDDKDEKVLMTTCCDLRDRRSVLFVFYLRKDISSNEESSPNMIPLSYRWEVSLATKTNADYTVGTNEPFWIGNSWRIFFCLQLISRH